MDRGEPAVLGRLDQALAAVPRPQLLRHGHAHDALGRGVGAVAEAYEPSDAAKLPRVDGPPDGTGEGLSPLRRGAELLGGPGGRRLPVSGRLASCVTDDRRELAGRFRPTGGRCRVRRVLESPPRYLESYRLRRLRIPWRLPGEPQARNVG